MQYFPEVNGVESSSSHPPEDNLHCSKYECFGRNKSNSQDNTKLAVTILGRLKINVSNSVTAEDAVITICVQH